MDSMVIFAGFNSTFSPALANLYARVPLIFFALKFGGSCSDSPLNDVNILFIFSSVKSVGTGSVSKISESGSSVEVVLPS